MSNLFSPLTLRDITFRNRIGVSPMCMYSSEDGMPNEWHLVHLGSRAVGGAGVVIAEATAVVPQGRISPSDAGIWNDEQGEAWARVVRFVKENGASPGIQLAHAGRKAGTDLPWAGGGPLLDLDWDVVGPSPIPFTEGYRVPREMTREDIQATVTAFKDAAKRALEAGFEVVEIHGAHGYLLHEFVSPVSNHRTDEYGGPFENRTRIVREVADAIRSVWPERLPLFVRISASDWIEGGWDIDQSIQLACDLKDHGVDLIDCSSGGNVAGVQIPIGPGYQVPFAAEIRKHSQVATAAVGLISDPGHADQIVQSGEADMIFLARELLRDPYWPRRAARELGYEISAPNQYSRAW